MPLHATHSLMVPHNWDKPEPVCQYLVLNDAGVVENVAVLDGKAVHFGHHDPSEGIRNRCVDMDEVEFGIVSIVAEEIHPERLTPQRLEMKWYSGAAVAYPPELP